PTSLQVIGLGHWAPYFHRVLLVFTDARLVEILLDFRGTSPETRIRSFAWTNVRDVRLRLLGLTLLPANGKKHRWNVTVRGDRKLLKLLLPRMRNHLRWETASRPGAVPASHCPTCYGVLAEHPASCHACGTVFRSPRVASLLSIAFPGAGLLYAGRTGLGLLDMVAEFAGFGILAAALATEGNRAEAVTLLGLGALCFVVTKAESMHVG